MIQNPVVTEYLRIQFCLTNDFNVNTAILNYSDYSEVFAQSVFVSLKKIRTRYGFSSHFLSVK